ncbi:MAG: recombinase family protein, partial [Dehalococcoidia bacterium]
MKRSDQIRAVAYLRVSSLSQVDGFSLDAQKRLFLQFCKSKGWIPIRVYREEGKSAHSDSIRKRPVLRQLLEDSGRDEFDVVVVHTLDRWARNQRVQLESLAILSHNQVSIASITENIDYSTPQGRMFLSMLGVLSEYSSDTLGTHVSQSKEQQAIQGRHTGGIPFGFTSCWENRQGERHRLCNPEHPGGVHLVPQEAAAVQELFQRYATGLTTLSELAYWLNDAGFRTRNTRKLAGPDGSLESGARLFTNASVRGILHNPFYMGMVKYKGQLFAGQHEALVSKEVFDLVEVTLRNNSGRSRNFASNPQREYLLQGIIRCAYCLMPMWAQTYKSGSAMYREHRASRGHVDCPSAGGSIKCATPDEQLSRVMEAIQLGPRWQEQVLAIISVQDEVELVNQKRKRVQERLRRLGKAFVDGVYDDAEYQRSRRQLELELESLVVPEADAAAEAGQLIEQLPDLWQGATLSERRKLLLTMLDGVYVDAKEEKRIVAIKPKPPFRPIFQIATTQEGSGVLLYPENGKAPELVGSLENVTPCSWWRRGRVELHRKHSCRLP